MASKMPGQFVIISVPRGDSSTEPGCRPGCGACCIAPSIHSAIPGMPEGKPAGSACVHLGLDFLCKLFGRPERPAFCGGLKPSKEMCGSSREEALAYLEDLERLTRPG
jgi:hypothetical protein